MNVEFSVASNEITLEATRQLYLKTSNAKVLCVLYPVTRNVLLLAMFDASEVGHLDAQQ